jgi:hypothetical protein
VNVAFVINILSVDLDDFSAHSPSWAARSGLVSDMNVVRKQFAKPGKGAKRPRKRCGPPAGILTKLIDFDPLDEAEWLGVARAIGCEPAELEKMTVAKGLTWRAGVECVINNSLNLLEAEGSGPTVPQLAAQLRKIASKTEEFRKFLGGHENIAASHALAELGYGHLGIPEEYTAVVQLKRRALAKAEEIEAEAVEYDAQLWINVFLADTVRLTRAAGRRCSLPTHGVEDERADEFPAYQLARVLIDLAHTRAVRVAPAAADRLAGLRNRTPRTLCERLRDARRSARMTWLLAQFAGR